jgi:hypothetical protein
MSNLAQANGIEREAQSGVCTYQSVLFVVKYETSDGRLQVFFEVFPALGLMGEAKTTTRMECIENGAY